MITCEIVRTETIQLPPPTKCVLTWNFHKKEDVPRLPQDYVIVEGQRYRVLSCDVKWSSCETEVTLECWKVLQ